MTDEHLADVLLEILDDGMFAPSDDRARGKQHPSN